MAPDNIEKAKQYWRFVADSVPILICLINQQGRVILANRTIERWGLGEASMIKGAGLHHAMHPGCAVKDCYLERFEREVIADIGQGLRSRLEVFDPQLKRHLAFDV